MVIALGAYRHLWSIRQVQRYTRTSLYGPNLAKSTTELLLKRGLQGRQMSRWSGEAELEILPAMEGKRQGIKVEDRRHLAHLPVQRNALGVQLRSYPTSLADVCQVTREPIADIEKAMERPILAQVLRFSKARTGASIAAKNIFGLHLGNVVRMQQHF